MHVHVIPGEQRTSSIHHSDDCLVTVVRDADDRVVRLAHSQKHGAAFAGAAGPGHAVNAECWSNLSDDEQRVPCACQLQAGNQCPEVLRQASHGTSTAA